MSYKPDEKDWMAYLYGEQEEGEKQKMEAYLLAHEDARQEMERYKHLRSMLASVGDQEVIAPPVFIDGGARVNAWRRFLHTPYLNLVAGIAASLLLLMVAAKIADARLTLGTGEVRLSFGAAAPAPQETAPAEEARLSAEEVQYMINKSLARNDSLWQASQEKLDASIRKNLAQSSGRIDRLVQEASAASQQQIRQFVDGIRTENMNQVKDYFLLTSAEQKQYIENLLVDFAKYLQQQRASDLQLVQTRMSSLEQNNDMFRQETEQILSSIITTVGNSPADEKKY